MPNLHPDYSLIDRSGAGSWIFYPRVDRRPAPAGASDHLIPVAEGVGLGARFYTADRSWPTVLYFHGNGEVASDHDDIAPFYHQIGLNLFVADFRGYGASGGRPTFATLVTDAHPIAEAFHQLLDEGGYAEPRFIMGRSLGSHPALELAGNRPGRFRGLVIESGAASLRRLVERFGVDARAAEAGLLVNSHEDKIRSIRMPALILHGERDELIPVEHAAQLYGLLEGAPEREIVVIPGAGHNDILWLGFGEYFAEIRAFVERSLH